MVIILLFPKINAMPYSKRKGLINSHFGFFLLVSVINKAMKSNKGSKFI